MSVGSATVAAGLTPPSSSTPTVLVARRLLPAGMELLAGRCAIRDGGLDLGREELLELARGVDAIVADPTVVIDEAVLDAAGPQLRVVANFAVGYDNVDLDACRRRGVAVTNTPDVLTNATAELALALTLAAARRMTEAEADLRGGRWRGWDPGAYLGLELTGATFGVVGLGRIGRRYAELVAGFAGRGPLRQPHPQGGGRARAGRPAGDAGGDASAAPTWSASTCRPASETTGLVGPRELSAMKTDGDPRQHVARARWSTRGRWPGPCATARSAGAGLDVYEHEPDVPSELLEAPRCVSCCPTSAPPPRERATAWLAWSRRTSSPCSTGEEPPNRVVVMV